MAHRFYREAEVIPLHDGQKLDGFAHGEAAGTEEVRLQIRAAPYDRRRREQMNWVVEAAGVEISTAFPLCKLQPPYED